MKTLNRFLQQALYHYFVALSGTTLIFHCLLPSTESTVWLLIHSWLALCIHEFLIDSKHFERFKKYIPILFSFMLSGFYFSSEILLFLIGSCYFLCLFWYSFKIVDDIQQALFPGFALVLGLGFLISTLLGNPASIALLNYFLTGILVLAFSQFSHEDFNVSYQDSFNLTCLSLFLTSLVLWIQIFQKVIYQFFESIVLGIWWVFSSIIQWILTISQGVILFVVQLVVQLLSQIQFKPGNSQPLPVPDNTPPLFEEEAIIESVFNPEIIKQIGFFVLGIVLLFLILYIMKKILTTNHAKKDSTMDLMEERVMMIPKPKSLFPWNKKTRNTKLSVERENYKKAVNSLIKEGYAYLPSMTPLEYLKSIPLEKSVESNLESLTNTYLTARYRKK